MDRLREIIQEAVAEVSLPELQERRRESQADVLIGLARKGCTFFRDPRGETFAAFEVGGHREVWPIESRGFKLWLSQQFFAKCGKSPNAEALSQARTTLAGIARFHGAEHKLGLRAAWHEGAIWYDLGDSAWRAVRITPDGWRVVDKPPILFRRYQNTAAQVEPEPGGDLCELLRLTNVKNEGDRCLLLAYLVAALVPEIPKPILHVFGEKGAGKSTLMQMVRTLVDPAVEPLLILRGDDRELAILLDHNYAPFFDNISALSSATSDMLCRAATGAGFSTRALYTNDEECIFSLKRLVGLNGIHLLTGGTDLQDRFLTIELERIDRRCRAQEQELLAEFERLRPKLFGAMLDALVVALRIKPTLHFEELPRMADWSLWAAAAGEALGIGAEKVMAAYWRNIGQVNERLLQSHPVAAAVMALLEREPEWQGTPAELLERLEKIAEQEKINVRAKTWPKSATALSRRLKEVASNLADAGVEMVAGRTGDKKNARLISLRRLAQIASDASGMSEAYGEAGLASDAFRTQFHGDFNCIRKPSDGEAYSEAGSDTSDASDTTLPSLKGEGDDEFDDIPF